MTQSYPDYLLKVLSPSTVPLGLGLQPIEFWMDKTIQFIIASFYNRYICKGIPVFLERWLNLVGR